MKSNKWFYCGVAIFALVSLASSVQAETAKLTATVEKTLVIDSSFGSCMASVNPLPGSVLAGCNSSWVTFSCTGDFNSKAVGQQKMQVAQLAQITGGTIDFYLDNTRKHSGYCFAWRVDLVTP